MRRCVQGTQEVFFWFCFVFAAGELQIPHRLFRNSRSLEFFLYIYCVAETTSHNGGCFFLYVLETMFQQDSTSILEIVNKVFLFSLLMLLDRSANVAMGRPCLPLSHSPSPLLLFVCLFSFFTSSSSSLSPHLLLSFCLVVATFVLRFLSFPSLLLLNLGRHC